jgi:hypothetical protein
MAFVGCFMLGLAWYWVFDAINDDDVGDSRTAKT